MLDPAAPMAQAPTKKRVTKSKKHQARNRWGYDRSRQRLGLLERLKPQ
jgi:hypothetical protein